MNEELICEFPFYQDQYTGKVEHTDLTDIDRAVAGFAQHVVNCLTVTDTERPENKEFARFSERQAHTKVYMGNVASEDDFVKKLIGKYCKGDSKRERNKVLPACYVTREPSIAFAEMGDHTDTPNLGRLENGEGVPYATVASSNLRLTYSMTVVAWSKPTLERIVIGFLMWLRLTKKSRQHTFKAKTKIAGSEFELEITVIARNDVIGESGEIALEETRMVSNRMSFDVVAQIIEAEEIVRTPATIGLMGGDQIE